MTTPVNGNQWNKGVLQEVNDQLNYLKGSDASFEAYSLNPRNIGSLRVTDGPKAGIIFSDDSEIEATIDGQPVDLWKENYELTVGKTLVIKGPEIQGQRAELKISHARPSNHEHG